MPYITQQGLVHLKNYEYTAGGMTWFEKKIDFVWDWMVKFLPTNLAPNTMTFMGWLFMCAQYGNMLRYDLTFDKQIPSWCFFFASFCVFAFITFDIIDGKQARKLKCGSPLGQLFDHGCDSFTMTSLMLGICEATLIDKDAVFTLFIITQLAFWTFNWVENHTGVLSTRVGNIGVIEGQFLCMIVHIITGIFGQKIWAIKPADYISKELLARVMYTPLVSKLVNVQLGTTLVYIGAFVVLIMTSYMIITTLIKDKNKFGAIAQYFSSILIVIMEVAWSFTPLFDQYCGLVLVNHGVLASLIMCKLIICTVTKMQVQCFHWQLIPNIISTLILIYLDITQKGMFAMKILFWITFVINLICVFSFIISAINQITTFLGIKCFSINKSVNIKNKKTNSFKIQEEKQRKSFQSQNGSIQSKKSK